MTVVFPLLRALGKVPQLTEVKPNAAVAARSLLFGSTNKVPFLHESENPTASFQCSYSVGEEFSIPMSFIGSCAEYGEETVLVHIPGLPGAFPVSMGELRRHRDFFHLDHKKERVASEESSNLSLFCATEAVKKGMGEQKVLDHLLSVTRRRLVSLRGAETLLKIGNRINEEALQLSFPYHCGANHASKRYLDITPEVCTLFGSHIKHGTKMLCRYGVAVMIGVALDESFGCPVPFWNPSGAPAACLAPMFNGCQTIPVGDVKLEYNGPTTNSVLLTAEDPVRYLNPTLDGKYDVTTWLNEGLFGVKVGQVVNDDCVVHGVCYNEKHSEFELHIRDLSTGEIRQSNKCWLN
ncbi:uncharacterized protein TM35_000072040 [Trypanosoma theileri]|uniref:Uncharacterized protein n=1 Tax=Trypanosoma theileri TaxID=67003 RepID=A0A1X0P300_9TRYP|nr:uncharacterized protein TM35_000072040 [Trypanosoma theileri]ORC90780.1 hypothetical protein TM35_000072040 [Trypanosoma theileri]